MTDDALLTWLADGAPVALSAEEQAVRRSRDYAQRFTAVLTLEDLGATQELHDAELARRVYELHCELEAYGIDEYMAAWFLLPSYTRAAFKKLVRLAVTNAALSGENNRE